MGNTRNLIANPNQRPRGPYALLAYFPEMTIAEVIDCSPVENRKCIEWPRIVLDLMVKSTLYYNMVLIPEAQIFYSISLYDQSFWRYNMLEKLHRMTSKSPYTLNCHKCPVQTMYLPSEGQFSVCFTPWPTIFKIQSCQKLEMHRMTSEWHETLNCQKYPAYAKYLPPSPNFCPFPSTVTNSHFQDTQFSRVQMENSSQS